MKEAKYVGLAMHEGSRVVGIKAYDTIQKSVDALDDLGLCCNWALANNVHDVGLLYYEGYASPSSPERFVKLPFESQDGLPVFAGRFKTLLWKIFLPFINKESSFIRVKTVKSGHLSGFVSVKMLLTFTTDCYADICASLDSVDDYKESSGSTMFILD